MRKAWREFKRFALGGNVVDLAIAFILGAAFTSVVQSLAKNVLLAAVSALFGSHPCTTTTGAITNSCDNLRPVLTLRHGQIHLGAFLGDALNFIIVALLMFTLVKLFQRAKLGSFKTLNPRTCPYCEEVVGATASRCRACTSQLPPLGPVAVPAAPPDEPPPAHDHGGHPDPGPPTPH
jgi:large conductance mechanosensitive channel